MNASVFALRMGSRNEAVRRIKTYFAENDYNVGIDGGRSAHYVPVSG